MLPLKDEVICRLAEQLGLDDCGTGLESGNTPISNGRHQQNLGSFNVCIGVSSPMPMLGRALM